jgi:predicted Zn-dependent protease
LARRWDEAFAVYDQAVRLRTGVAALRCDFARDLLRATRADAARQQLAEAKLLDPEDPMAEALRARLALLLDDTAGARAHARQALAWGPWCDAARIELGAAERHAGARAAADSAWAPVEDRLDQAAPPEWIYRADLATWEPVHELPAVERERLAEAKRR